MNRKVYYAHCIAIYDTPQEKRDIELLEQMFPDDEIYNPNNEECNKGYQTHGMDFFKAIIETCDVFVFRSLPGGKIPAGVHWELQLAIKLNIPVLELPSLVGRELSLEDTRAYLKEVGYR